ncbi:MAG: DUF4091 domain-containing protein [Tannerella sp.]|jgi:hypothetical protein|nr:DUF4091 domain-containing protein [Tannerella sp.]
MKYSIIIPILLLTGCSANPEIECVQLDPLEKVLKEQIYFEENADTAAVAKGETATFQFVLRSIHAIQNLKIEATDLTDENQAIPVGVKAFVGYVRQGRNIPDQSKDRLISASGFFPDPLLELETMDVPAMSNQPVWINYPVSRTAKDGLYTAEVTFSGKQNGKSFKIRKIINVKVYPVVLPEQTLWVTNWFSLSENNLKLMNGGQPVTPYSERYWELVKALANKTRDHGQNVYLISPLHLCEYTVSGTKYGFDFANFDKTVELFIHEGNLKRIEGGHLGSRLSDWSSQFGLSTPVMRDGKTRFELKPLENDTAKTFLSQFIPALTQHLKEKNWDKIYWQHIADEPTGDNASSYIAIADEVKRMAPDLEIIEANHSREVQNTIRVWVPQLNFFHTDYPFYRERQRQGDEVWFYTCLAPKGNYANRFLEQPLILTRTLHWINYRFGATGYLHWGLNYWNNNPYGETTGINTEGGNILPGGDSWITYPADGKLFGSIRFDAMRDGIADYELLKLLEKTHPEEAREIARTHVYRFDWYDNNIAAFRQKRIKLLELLSE